MSETSRSDKNNNEDWKKYDKSLHKRLALDNLRESLRKQDEDKVEEAIMRCRDVGLREHEHVKNAAEIHLPVITARKKLLEACKNFQKENDDKELEKEIRDIKRNGLSPYLHVELIQAKFLLARYEDSKTRGKGKKVPVAMDGKTVAEIRHYQKPPKILHDVVQATLLLLGEDEDTTDIWKNCQRICNPHGPTGLCRKVVSFDLSKVHPEIVARSKQILEKIDFEEVEKVGKGAPVAFYVWAMGSIDRTEAKDSKDKKQSKDRKEDKEEVKPANRKRQREILGRLPPPLRESQEFYIPPGRAKKKVKPQTDPNDTLKPRTDPNDKAKFRTDPNDKGKPYTDPYEKKQKPKTEYVSDEELAFD